MMEHNGYNTTTRRGCTKKCCCIACCSAFCLIIVAVVITLVVMFHVYRPRLPEFQVDSFSFKNFTAVSHDSNSSKVSFAADVAMTARNPNKPFDIFFSDAQATVYYKKKPLGSNGVASLSIDKDRKTSLNMSFAADVDGVGDINNANVTSFELWLFTKFWYKDIKGKFNGKAFCGDLAVGLPSDGKPGGLTRGPKKCKFDRSSKGARDPVF